MVRACVCMVRACVHGEVCVRVCRIMVELLCSY